MIKHCAHCNQYRSPQGGEVRRTRRNGRFYARWICAICLGRIAAREAELARERLAA